MNKNTLKVGLIGAGIRSREHIKNVINLGGAITGIADISEKALEIAGRIILETGSELPHFYTGHSRAFEEMLEKETFDAVIIAATWDWLIPMSITAMKSGVPYVGIEVSSVNSLDDCWKLVEVQKETGCHFTFLENACYRRDVLAVLNMVRSGIFGELIHCRCGYEHDLRDIKFGDSEKLQPWRIQHSIDRNGDLYPTHGIGPIASLLDINHGNRFVNLTSMSTQSLGLKRHIINKAGENHPYANLKFKCGDVVTSMIKCAGGQTVIITHDTNSPRPYSLGFRVQGTNGLWNNDGNLIYIEGKSTFNTWENDDKWFLRYDHPLWKLLEERAKGTGHDGIDYIMMYDFLESVKNNTPPPFDVYDAATWMSISPLSEMSITSGGNLVEFPDFTNGKWKNSELKHFKL